MLAARALIWACAPFAASAFIWACAGAGTLQLPHPASIADDGAMDARIAGDGAPGSCSVASDSDALACYAPIVLQELQPGAIHLDRPTTLDADGSRVLADDLDSLIVRLSSPDSMVAAPATVPFYTATSSDSTRLYLFYGLYYPADWSGSSRAPRIDHRGDFEGALVVVSRHSGLVEAVITQAHKLFYLWTPPASPRGRSRASSGSVWLLGNRPVLFAESGGHGLYAFGRGTWKPRGGRSYPAGPAGVPPERLLRIVLGDRRSAIGQNDSASVVQAGVATATGTRFSPDVVVEIRPLDDLHRFMRSRASGFRDLPRGALPPWLWADRREGRWTKPGALLNDPARYYEDLLRRPRP
jgi:hypothetical protein